MIALAARCANRILPAFLPTNTQHIGKMAEQFRAADAAVALALLEASRGEVDRSTGPLFERATATISEGQTIDQKAHRAQQCLQSLSNLASTENIASREDLLGSAVESYLGVGSETDMESVLERLVEELNNDINVIEAFRLGAPGKNGKPVPIGFFDKPLWGGRGMPSAWFPIVERWSKALSSIDFAVPAKHYEERTTGKLLTIESLAERVREWDESYVGFSAKPIVQEVVNVADTLEQEVKQPRTQESETPTVTEQESSTPPQNPPDVWMLSDQPLEDDDGDILGFKDYADALAAVLDHEDTATPFTMAINAPWGAGKTTLAGMIERRLKARPTIRGDAPHITCWFNAWMHDDAPSMAGAIVSELTREITGHRVLLDRLWNPIPQAVREPHISRFIRFLWYGVGFALLAALAVWLSAHLLHNEEIVRQESSRTRTVQVTETEHKDLAGKGISKSTSETKTEDRPVIQRGTVREKDSVDIFIGKLESSLLLLGAFLTGAVTVITAFWKFLTALPFGSRDLGELVENPAKAAGAGSINKAREQLGRLIEQATWRGNRVIIFVDDIERCNPPRPVELLEAVNQLLDHPNVITILLGDMAAVAASAQIKYKELSQYYVPSGVAIAEDLQGKKEAFGRLYLQKIIQFQFDLPNLTPDMLKTYVEEMSR